MWATEGRLADVESVSLAFCHDVSDADLHVLARLPKLRALHLDGCRGLTDAAVDAVAKSCPQLTRLSLYWLPSITDRGALVAASLPALTHLSLSGLKHLSVSSPRPARARPPHAHKTHQTRDEARR